MGAFLTPWPLVIIIAASTGAVAIVLMRQSLAVIVAVTAVLLLGTVYGQVSLPSVQLCAPEFPIEGKVTEVRERVADVQFTLVTATGCSLLVTVGSFPEVQVGDEVQISGGSLQPIAKVREYSDGYADYLVRKGISGTISHPQIKVLEQFAGQRPLLAQMKEQIKSQIETIFVEPDTSIVTAMLVADQGQIPSTIVDQFRNTGIIHVLAISGSHISLIASLLLVLLGLVPLRPWSRSILLLIILWLYIVGIGAPVSAIRAGWFWTIALLGLRLHLLLGLPSVILLATAILMVKSPAIWLDVGWQLSASAVIGIFVMLWITKSWRERHRELPTWLVATFLASLGAGLATAPLVAFHFGVFSPISLLANLLVVPVMPFLIALSIIVVFVGPIWPALALLLALPVHYLLAWTILVAATLSRLPHAYQTDIEFSFNYVVIYYAAILAGIILLQGTKPKTWRQLWVA